jgi:hypothetical protein
MAAQILPAVCPRAFAVLLILASMAPIVGVIDFQRSMRRLG